MERKVVGGMSEWSGLLKDLFRQIDDGTITWVKLEAFVNNRIAYPKEVTEYSVLDNLVRQTRKLLSRRFGKKILVDPLPKQFTLENLAMCERYNLKPVFLPDEEIGETRRLRDWVKPEKWFYQKIKEGKIAKDSATLKSGWYLADFTPSADYDNGSQVYPNDPLSPIIARLRREREVGKYDKTPMGSRFAIVPKTEWPIVLAEVAKELGLKPEQVRLERAIEFNAIGNLYDSNRGKFNAWEWFSDPFEDFILLYGGHHIFGGLAYVRSRLSVLRHDFIAGRPLVSFSFSK